MEILTLGNKIKIRRKEMNLTLKELAGERITPAQLSYVETDKCKPSLDLLQYIADKLGLEMDYLLESEKKQVSKFCEHNIRISRLEIQLSKFGDARERLSQVLLAAKSYDLCEFTGKANGCIALIYDRSNDYQNAVYYYLKALNEFSKADDYENASKLYLRLGVLTYNKEYFKSSILYLNHALNMAEKVIKTDFLLKPNIYYNMAIVYDKIGDGKNAVYYTDMANESLKECFNLDRMIDVLSLKEPGQLIDDICIDNLSYHDRASTGCIACDIHYADEAEDNMKKIYAKYCIDKKELYNAK